jgi:hypothetical protein
MEYIQMLSKDDLAQALSDLTKELMYKIILNVGSDILIPICKKIIMLQEEFIRREHL